MKKLTFRNDILPMKDKLFRLALRITMRREDAEDVVQETMLKLWKQRERWEEMDNIEAYAMTICRNKAIDTQRLAESNTVSLEAEPPIGRFHDPYEQLAYKEKLTLVEQAMRQLPEKQRSCMHLRDFEGKNYKEIAEVMGITEDQVKVNIFRARKTIKQTIDQNA